MNETTDIEVHIVKSDDKIGGVGEPGVPTVAPAVGNAIFDAVWCAYQTPAHDADNRPGSDKKCLNLVRFRYEPNR